MKTLFEAAACMDIIHLHRVADLLAWFVSNNNYQWPWARWDRVLDASPLNMHRRFCSLTLAKMTRLCANLAYIQQHILPQDDRWLALIPPSDQPTAPPPDPDNPGGLVQPYESIMQSLMAKISDQEMEDQLRKCAEECEGGLRAVLGYFMRTLLIRASLSPFHTETLLGRYRTTLKNLIAAVCIVTCD
jgi:nuclear cap-binding protein subunit 1